MPGLLLAGSSQGAEHKREGRGQLILGGEGAAELLGQRRDDLAGVLRRDVVGGFVVLDGDQEIGVQITSGAQAAAAVTCQGKAVTIDGTRTETEAMLVIVAPLYIPLVASLDLGFDNQLIWYGILYTITCQIAYITPPFGYNLFLMRAMAPRDFTLGVIYRSVLPFVLIMVLTLALVIAFPGIALWLPQHIYG